MTRLASFLAALVLAGFVFGGQIQIPDWDNSVAFRLVASQEPVRPGDAFQIAIVAEIVEGYHLYGPEEQEPSRTEVAITGEGLTAGEPDYPAVVTRDLSGLGTYDLYEGNIAIRVPVKVDNDLVEGEHILKATVSYQVCTDFACSAPASEELSLTLPASTTSATVRHLFPEIFERE